MRIRPLILITGFVAVLAIGCSSTDTTSTGSGGGGTTTPTTAATSGTTKPAPGTSTAPGSTAGSGATAIALKDTALGSILVDGSGMTVYAFAKDTPTSSACTGGCVDAWPAVSGSTADPGTGLDADDFTSITGADGKPQLVFYGHPLYTYAGDNAPGDTTGQGVGGFWYVVGADGNTIQTAP